MIRWITFDYVLIICCIMDKFWATPLWRNAYCVFHATVFPSSICSICAVIRLNCGRCRQIARRRHIISAYLYTPNIRSLCLICGLRRHLLAYGQYCARRKRVFPSAQAQRRFSGYLPVAGAFTQLLRRSAGSLLAAGAFWPFFAQYAQYTLLCC